MRCDLSSIQAFSWAQLFMAIGLFLVLELDGRPFQRIFGDGAVFVVVIVMFFILVSTTLSTKSYYPGEDEPGERIARIGGDGRYCLSIR